MLLPWGSFRKFLSTFMPLLSGFVHTCSSIKVALSRVVLRSLLGQQLIMSGAYPHGSRYGRSRRGYGSRQPRRTYTDDRSYDGMTKHSYTFAFLSVFRAFSCGLE